MYFLSLIILLVLPFGELLRFEILPDVRFRVLDILAFTLALVITYTKTEKDKNIARPVFAFAAILVISLLTNIPSPLSAYMYLFRTLTYLYILTHHFLKELTPKQKIVFNRTLTISFALLPFTGLVQYFLYPNLRNLYYLGYDPHMYRLFGSLLDPNLIGILFVWMFFYLVQQKRSLYTFSLVVVSIISLLFTYSRISWISFVAGLFTQKLHLNIKKYTVVFGALIFIAVVLFALPRYFGEGTNIWRVNSIFAKQGSAETALELVKKNPLIGIGFNNIPLYKKDSVYQDNSLFGVDNSFLTVFVTTGIIGLASYLFLFYSLFKRSTGFARLLVVTYFIHSLSTNSFFTPTIFLYFVFLRELSQLRKKPDTLL